MEDLKFINLCNNIPKEFNNQVYNQLYKNDENKLILKIGIIFKHPDVTNHESFLDLLKYIINIKFDKDNNDYKISEGYTCFDYEFIDLINGFNRKVDLIFLIEFNHFFNNFKFNYCSEYYNNFIKKLLELISDIANLYDETLPFDIY